MAALSANHNRVIIIGGGATGHLVSLRLAEKRQPHLILESGPLLPRPFPRSVSAFEAVLEPLIAIDHSKWTYESKGIPYSWPRIRAAGGRTLLWGGWCGSLHKYNLEDAATCGSPWPVRFSALNSYARQAEKYLNVKMGRVPPQFLILQKKMGLVVHPKKASLVAGELRPSIALDWHRKGNIKPNATVQRILVGHQKVEGVEYLCTETNKAEVMTTKTVVLCASPIETARILHKSQCLHLNRALLGKNLTDHMVASFLVILDKPANADAAGPLERVGIIPRFVNLDSKNKRDYMGGFTLELKGPLPLNLLRENDLKALRVDLNSASQLSFYVIHAMGEVFPDAERFVTFDVNSIPIIHWQWAQNDRSMARDMIEAAESVAQALASPGSRIIEIRNPLLTAGAGHETGLCRMGHNPDRSITDPYGAVHGIEGLYIADASVMPTALDIHPTLPLLALSLRTTDRLISL